jgi:hypothetical protein
VLYWYRTPPGVRIGRRPFDEEAQRALERQNPGIEFAWDTIINTPMPPPDMTEYWRERRRAEKAARQERRAAEADGTEPPSEPAGASDEDSEPQMALESAPEAVAMEQVDISPEQASTPANADVTGGEEGQGPRKRRRRRGGRRRRGAGADSPEQETASGGRTPESVESPTSAGTDGQSEDDESASEEE